MDRVRRRIQSSGTVVELFQGYVADLHASYFPPPPQSPTPPIYLHLNEIVFGFIRRSRPLSYVNVYCRDISFDFSQNRIIC